MINLKRKLTLVGAGPGDEDLITVKGVKALQRSRVILYDALVNTALLDYTQAGAKLVFVGKRSGQPSADQEKINQLIVSYALVYGEVVRLKGGDPFIFGRGYEEIVFAEKNGLETEVIPGISSATGLTALKKISLTQRGVSYGFWVMTASKAGNEFNDDLLLAAQSQSTVIILMGFSKLAQITEIYRQQGLADMPVLIIQNGSLKTEKSVSGTISEIERRAKAEKLSAPAIIVIGEVLNFKSEQEELLNKVKLYLN